MARSTLSDEEIVYRLKTDTDPALLNELMQRHQASVLRQCQRYIRNREDAQDVAQEVFLRVLLRLPGFKGEASIATWLNCIAYRRCMDHLRKNKKPLNFQISKHIIDSLVAEWDAEDPIKPTLEDMEELMEKISGEEKVLLTLKYKNNQSIKAIMIITGLPESIIKNRIYRAKNKLRMLLQDKSL